LIGQRMSDVDEQLRRGEPGLWFNVSPAHDQQISDQLGHDGSR
jgi:hypothetical protein